MEDVLDVYQRAYDPHRPVLCLDELPVQLVGEVFTPLPMERGKPKREDYEYKREGTASVFMVFEPLAGKRYLFVRSRRTACDWAEVMQQIADELYPEAERIVMVMDNLNTHDVASLYKRFVPSEAWRLRQRFEIHHTPVHGSWLNVAEIELSVLVRQCLERRIGDIGALDREVQAWARLRNEACACVDWQFTTADARIKLKRLYPKIEER
ncbi:hypothetical protein HRbin16_00055 [bacterium HR16]|nr:hypothetical protein HRbin16_00055 [bacterium HR16]